MENQDIKWETWGEQPQETNEQPQQNWGEQQQQQPQQNWGEQQQQPQQGWGEQPQQGWGEQSQQEVNSQQDLPSHSETVNWENSEENNSTPSKDFWNLQENGTNQNQPNQNRKHSFLGLLPKLKIEALIYKVDYDNKLATQEIINGGFEPIDKDSRFALKVNQEGELLNILNTIKGIGEIRGMDLQHSYLYKNNPNESVINVSRGECIYSYIYFLQADYNSGEVILDLSALNGPAEQVLEASPGILLLLPGWVPYRISKNQSNQDMIAIAGRFVAKN
jgi:hypothetical protein